MIDLLTDYTTSRIHLYITYSTRNLMEFYDDILFIAFYFHVKT